MQGCCQILVLFTIFQISHSQSDLRPFEPFEEDSYEALPSGEPPKWELQKNKNYHLIKKYRTLEKEKTEKEKKKPPKINSKIQKKKGIKDDTYFKDERWQLCQSITEDSVRDSLLKFGMVTHIISDADKFRKSMKSLKDSVPVTKEREKKRRGPQFFDRKIMREKEAPPVKVQKSNFLGRSFAIDGLEAPSEVVLDGAYEEGFNNLMRRNRNGPSSKFESRSWGIDEDTRRRRRRRSSLVDAMTQLRRRNKRGSSYLDAMSRDTRRKGTTKNFDQVPKCYGWRYLSTLDALSEDNSADTEVLTGSVSDMLDMHFANAINDIIMSCEDGLQPEIAMCPPEELVGVQAIEGQACFSQCQVDSDCADGELCCRQGCGENQCVKIKGSKKENKCDLADQFMQCIYNMIDSQLCENWNPDGDVGHE